MAAELEVPHFASLFCGLLFLFGGCKMRNKRYGRRLTTIPLATYSNASQGESAETVYNDSTSDIGDNNTNDENGTDDNHRSLSEVCGVISEQGCTLVFDEPPDNGVTITLEYNYDNYEPAKNGFRPTRFKVGFAALLLVCVFLAAIAALFNVAVLSAAAAKLSLAVSNVVISLLFIASVFMSKHTLNVFGGVWAASAECLALIVVGVPFNLHNVHEIVPLLIYFVVVVALTSIALAIGHAERIEEATNDK